MNIKTCVQGLRSSDALGVVLVGCAFAIGVVSYDAMPAEMVIHVTPPGGVYFGPEMLPKHIGLFIIPVVTAITFVVLRVPPLFRDVNEAGDPIRPYYQFGIVLLVTFLLCAQASLVILNVL